MTGNTAGNRTAPADLRVSDAERDAVAEELARHHQEGRLDATEFDERVGRAVGARTQGDLDPLLADLPPRPPEPRPAPRLARRGAHWVFPLAAITFVAVAIGLGAAAHGGHPPDGRPGPWAIWWLWWVIPVTIIATRRWLRGHRPYAGR
jgi:Domain of unknown function (DUF1707)